MTRFESRSVTRRRLLRGAGATAAGAAGAVALSATPAHAAPGENLLQGVPNDAGTTTTTIASSGDGATLALQNSQGAALELAPTPLAELARTGVATGTMATDPQGNFLLSGTDFGSGTVGGWIYTAEWASMTVPIPPQRILDTRTASGRANIVSGAGNISGGRLLAGKTITVKVVWATKPEAVIGNLTVVSTAGRGYLTMWASGTRPTTASLNFWGAGQALSCLTESPVTTSETVTIYASATTAVIFDVCGFVVPNRHQVGVQ